MTSQEELKELLNYDPTTGEFIWLVNRGPMGKGSAAGWMDGKGYRYITIDGKKRGAHRWAFLYMEGAMPDEVDHINNVRVDNRWSNLRGCSRSDNMRNASLSKANTTGVKGVSLNSRNGNYLVRIRVGGVYKSFGEYGVLELAELVAREVREKYHGEYYNHG